MNLHVERRQKSPGTCLRRRLHLALGEGPNYFLVHAILPKFLSNSRDMGMANGCGYEYSIWTYTKMNTKAMKNDLSSFHVIAFEFGIVTSPLHSVEMHFSLRHSSKVSCIFAHLKVRKPLGKIKLLVFVELKLS